MELIEAIMEKFTIFAVAVQKILKSAKGNKLTIFCYSFNNSLYFFIFHLWKNR